MNDQNTTICAQSSATGPGAVSIIRLSGKDSIKILDSVFKGVSDLSFSNTSSYKMRFGTIISGAESEVLDEVLAVVFRAPHSYTGEDSAEIYCHGSEFIVSEILKLLISRGAALAAPGEFTKRAFLNGKLDLTQAEAVADLIASETQASHDVALQQMKGGFSDELKLMRTELVDMASLMELELDFSEEDVEFADREKLFSLLEKVQNHISELITSFTLGNVIKNGVPVAIVGATNTGKSTLLNALLGEERAIVSEIAGTTRDVIEDTINIDGITFRFIDTAGIRNTTETIEMIGIERTYSKMKQASIIILMIDALRPDFFGNNIGNFAAHLEKTKDIPDRQIIILLNKSDLISEEDLQNELRHIQVMVKKNDLSPMAVLPVSAKKKIGIDTLSSLLVKSRKTLKTPSNSTLVTNLRHWEALKDAQTALTRVKEGLASQIPTDLVCQDIREALYYIGSITGEVTSDEILGNIFGKFCIGK